MRRAAAPDRPGLLCWHSHQQPRTPGSLLLQRMENDLRGGDWASPPDLNLSDKTRAFRKKKKATKQAR